jgi:tetratricopeptide (TPR) repeat protein
MFKHIENAVKIDPYNMDAYYFSQAAFTWEVGHAKDVNKVLDYGMKYRTWDYWLPFYAGFNAAYFLKDYEAAAKYMQIAAELSKSTLYTQLAARYFHEAGNAGLGLMFLETMAKGAKEENIKRAYQLRIEAFKAVRQIEDTVSGFSAQYERLPETLAVLIDAGMLSKIPKDPYGGEFYLDETGKVRTSSGFSMMPEESEVSPDSLEMEDDPSQKKGMY